ncbi:uncharacterized protein LOC116341313 [Contarinia nasturtii]|uniref:uncharacterized protein LOC116341313 n=1 Tax=Contarinia nasturtii TaxID=265458 RepID=UPI0012D40E33|nr:uncharacterized protein LOC116341313 [Contarinia nasturtii]
MERRIFLISICLIFSTKYSVNGEKKVASIDASDIKEFRAKYYVEPVNDLSDLNETSIDVIGVFEKIKELEKRGFDMLNLVPDNGATCSIQVKYYISTIIERAKEQIDYCVEKHLNIDNRLELNTDQKSCTLEILDSAQKQIDDMSKIVDDCRFVV